MFHKVYLIFYKVFSLLFFQKYRVTKIKPAVKIKAVGIKDVRLSAISLSAEVKMRAVSLIAAIEKNKKSAASVFHLFM